MRHAIIVSGPNGSGKSTFAEEYKKEYNYGFINADEIEKVLENPGTTKSHIQAGRIFFDKLKMQISNHKNFILESTLSGNYLVKFLKELKKENYYITIVYIVLESPEFCIERIRVRVKKGGHFVNPLDVKRRFYRSKNNLWKTYKNLADEWIAILNSGEKPETFLIGEKENYFVLNEFILNQFLEDIDESR
jgi:predicted ABC-type ATPase